ncbi:MAG TPA: MaoC family dehydratase N-terminal domain-containing protein [Mycobacteriales bacterium]|nr:MaoC family dehydratase N-terminal domain-containing protein [Mycobacteriales bacterium]
MAEPFEMRIELGKVREFARATGSSNPEYLTGDTPPAPVTFPMVTAFWSGPENFESPGDIDLARVLHGGQEFVYPDGPPEAGAVLTAQMRLGNKSEKEGKRGGTMTIQELVTEFTDPSGKLVAQSITTMVVTSKPTGAS